MGAGGGAVSGQNGGKAKGGNKVAEESKVGQGKEGQGGHMEECLYFA